MTKNCRSVIALLTFLGVCAPAAAQDTFPTKPAATVDLTNAHHERVSSGLNGALGIGRDAPNLTHNNISQTTGGVLVGPLAPAIQTPSQ
jgi:hypothetical protein